MNIKIVIAKPERKLEIFTFRKEKYIEEDFEGLGYVYVDWIHLVWNRAQWLALMNTVMEIMRYIKDKEVLG